MCKFSFRGTTKIQPQSRISEHVMIMDSVGSGSLPSLERGCESGLPDLHFSEDTILKWLSELPLEFSLRGRWIGTSEWKWAVELSSWEKEKFYNWTHMIVIYFVLMLLNLSASNITDITQRRGYSLAGMSSEKESKCFSGGPEFFGQFFPITSYLLLLWPPLFFYRGLHLVI